MNCRRWPVVLGKTFALPPARVILLLSKEKWPALSSRRRSLCRPEVRDDGALLRRAVPSVICIVLPSSLSSASAPCRVDRTYPFRGHAGLSRQKSLPFDPRAYTAHRGRLMRDAGQNLTARSPMGGLGLMLAKYGFSRIFEQRHPRKVQHSRSRRHSGPE
jgi:hypothetical protein